MLVGKDGVQRPPIHFPRGGHMLAFISCLETGLSPNGALDPPLWSQRGKGEFGGVSLARENQLRRGYRRAHCRGACDPAGPARWP